jgi:hypothetical protein
MSSGVEKAKRVLGAVSTGLAALEAIGELAKHHLGDRSGFPDDKVERMSGALGMISSIVDAARGALEGKVTLDDLEAEIKKVTSDLAFNDGQVQSDIDAKFPK